MPHFYVPPENISGKNFRITGEDARHIISVLRYGAGDGIKLFDGKGNTLAGVIDSISKDGISGTVISSCIDEKTVVNLHLYQAVPKGEKFDWLVEKAAELGVAAVTPVISERSIMRELSDAKVERWRRLSKAASKQCGRADLMEINDPLSFDELLSRPLSGLNIIPWEAENSRTVREVCAELLYAAAISPLNGLADPNCLLKNEPVGSVAAVGGIETRTARKNINIFIGPEGGFSLKEIDLARCRGLHPVTLGTRILRSETAGLMSVILILSIFGEYEKFK